MTFRWLARQAAHWFELFAGRATVWAGSSWAFFLAVLVLLVWAVTGPFCQFSDTWQLVINTGTTIITFLMVFVIQQTQNKESMAIHLKLNEIVAALNGASNRLINVERLTESEVRELYERYQKLAKQTSDPADICASHSIEETEGMDGAGDPEVPVRLGRE